MPHSATRHSLASSSTQVASEFSHPSPDHVPKPEPRNTSGLWCSSWRHKPLPTLPEEGQQDEVYSVEIVNYLNRDDDNDRRVTITCSDPERRVEWIEKHAMAEGERALIEGLMGGFQSLRPSASKTLLATSAESKQGASSHHYSDPASPPSRSLSQSQDVASLLDEVGSTDETDWLDSSSSWTTLNEPCPSPATWSTARSSTTGRSSILSPQHECLSPPRSLCLEYTRLRDQSYTPSQNQESEWIPSSQDPYGTVEPPPHIVITDDQTERHPTPTSSTRGSSQHHKPTSRPISRPSIDLDFSGYKPDQGPSPLFADQATAHHVYRAIRLHELNRLRAHPDWSAQPAYLRIQSRHEETRRADKHRAALAAANADAAQALRAAAQAAGVAPGPGRARVRTRAYDNSAWHAAPPRATDVVPPRRGRRSYASSTESVYASSTRSLAPTPEPVLAPSRTPSPLGAESASSSGSSSESENSLRLLRTPTTFEPRDLNSVWVKSNGSPARPLVVPQPSLIDGQWEKSSEKLPAVLTMPTPTLRRSKRFL